MSKKGGKDSERSPPASTNDDDETVIDDSDAMADLQNLVREEVTRLEPHELSDPPEWETAEDWESTALGDAPDSAAWTLDQDMERMLRHAQSQTDHDALIEEPELPVLSVPTREGGFSAHPSRRATPLPEHTASSRVVVRSINLAAALGLTPEDLKAAAARAMEPIPARNPKAYPIRRRAAETDDEPEPCETVALPTKAVTKASIGKPKPNQAPSSELDVTSPTLFAAIDSAAKIIPIIFGAFLVIATVMVSIQLFPSSSSEREHVQLRFISKNSAALMLETEIRIQTTPEGVLVLHDQEVLGETPLTAELKVPPGKFTVELTSPQFETWRAQLDPADAYEITANLILKAPPVLAP